MQWKSFTKIIKKIYLVNKNLLKKDSANPFSFVVTDGTITPICYGSLSKDVIDAFAVNLHRIDKDVARCDRAYPYFTNINNLKKLRNVMCT